MSHLFWIPSLVLGGTVTAAASSGGPDYAGLAALLGGIAAVISAITGLVIALARSGDSKEKIIVLTPEEAAEEGYELKPPKKRTARRAK